MASFMFRFQNLLAHRERIEDQCQRELAQLMRQRMIIENQLRAMQQTIVSSKADLSNGLVGQVDLTRVSQFARYSGQVAQRARAMVVKLSQLEKEISQAREGLMAATRERKALDLLKDKHYRAWKLRQDRLETAELDDLAVQSFARKTMGIAS